MLLTLALLFAANVIYAQSSLKAGDKLPLFVLKDQDGNDFVVSEYIGKHKLVIFFYHKDDSEMAVKEVCGFRDSYPDFKAANAMIIGIGNGSVESHKAFRKQHNLPYVLLSDPQNDALRLFGSKTGFFHDMRDTFITDLGGNITYTYRGHFKKGEIYSEKVLSYLRTDGVN
ncbi:alkyl hydroperoxide reductase/ Thiol specific antioxidant/ Mal allergen [Chitinophaga pinensis DSM 2588]|uniref:thioredoxin-dependent peroxiredoxin n=2 Tax=Chitinophaga pinensis TaxID=79329 RepID=A0A979FYU2_CHIPD|nr:alkyl hydroperoxide reductase/ Thiol specific antioxidant/ Mal allergen [Chitinophaga pinensis DSM 2588]